MKQLISAALCAGLFATQPGIIYAAEDDPIITATPVPEHSAYYSQAARHGFHQRMAYRTQYRGSVSSTDGRRNRYCSLFQECR